MFDCKTPGVGSSEAPGDGAGTGARQLTAEQRAENRLRLWAFGTSPHGLGLSSVTFWALTSAEFHALKEVHDAPVRRWAIEQATLHNAHFVTEGVPWTADDFMGCGNRKDRMMRQQRDNIDMAREQMRIARIVPGAPPPPDTPSWAIGEYHAG